MLPVGSSADDILLVRWLAASGEALLTDMRVASFVAWRSRWLASVCGRRNLSG